MTKHFYSILSFAAGLCFIVFPCRAQQATRYSAGNTTVFQNIITTADGNLVVVGDYTKNASAPNIITITKTTLSGAVIWTKTFGKDIQQNGLYVVETKDGGYVVSGIELTFDNGTFESSGIICLFKLTKDGALVWSHYLQCGNQQNILANALTATADGGVLVGGSFTQAISNSIYTINYLAKIDRSGALSWSKQFDMPGYRRWIVALIEVKTGFAIVSESFTGNSNRPADAVNVSLLNNAGVVLKSVQVSIQGGPVHFIQSACATKDSSIAIAGTSGTGPGNFDLWLLKINASLKVSWSSTIDINTDDRPNKITELENGHLLVTGVTLNKRNIAHPVIIELATTGKLLQEKTLAADDYRGAYGVAIKKDTAYMLVNDQFGIGSNYPVVYCFNILSAVCNIGDVKAQQRLATNLVVENRPVAATNVVTAISDMPYTAAPLKLMAASLCTVLPLTLLTFTVTPKNNANQLQWTIAGDENIDHFTIERYSNGGFISLSNKVLAEKATADAYAFTDEAPLAGDNRYRLKMTDRNGTVTYSFVATAAQRNRAAVLLSPNPATDYTVLKLRFIQATAIQYTLTNSAGIAVLHKKVAAPVYTKDEFIATGRLSPGIYFIQVIAGSESYLLRLVKE